MNVIETTLPGVLILEPKIFGDDRGFFYESFNARSFQGATGLNPAFVQDNHSRSARGVLRGLHYQVQQPQGKLVRVTQGEVFDVAVDLRRHSATFGQAAIHRNIVPFGALLAHPVFVFPRIRGGNAEIGDCIAVGHVAHFGVFAQVAH